METVVVGAGFLGSKIVEFFAEKGIEAKGTSLKGNADFFLDVTDKKQVEKFFLHNKPKTTVLCASLSDVDACNAFPEKAALTNVEGARNVFEACSKNKSKLVLISTDYVFDGKKGDYEENERTHPIQVYGETKLEAEKIALKDPKNIVLRVSSLYGKSPVYKKTFENHVTESLLAGKKIMAASDQVTSPTLIDDAAKAVFSLLEKNENGLFHAGGAEPVSRYDFALKVAEENKLDKRLIEKVSMDKIGFKAKRPRNASLNIKKLQSLKIKMSTIEEGLEKTKEAAN